MTIVAVYTYTIHIQCIYIYIYIWMLLILLLLSLESRRDPKVSAQNRRYVSCFAKAMAEERVRERTKAGEDQHAVVG